jgi:cysteine-rich secretory family protein
VGVVPRRGLGFLWVTAVVAAVLVAAPGPAMAAPPGTGATITEAEKQEILDQHNLFRAEVGSPPLVWDDTIATGAQNWADAKQADGKFEHSPPESRSGLGENLVGGEVKDATIRLATGRGVSPPVDERAVYQSNPVAINDQNFKVFGHYTQIVWDTTTRIGCGYAPRNKLGFGLVVCQYGPGGNLPGRFPYPQGTVPQEQQGLTALGVSKPGATQAGGTQDGTTAGGTQGGGDGSPGVVNATATTLPCGSVTRSPDVQGAEATVTIVNNSPTPVTISWLSRDGQKESPVTAAPNGGPATLTTFAEDVWQADADGRCLTLLKGAGTVTFD